MYDIYHIEKNCLGKISDSTREYTYFIYDLYLSDGFKRHISDIKEIKKYL